MVRMVKKFEHKDPLSAAMDIFLRITDKTTETLGKEIGYKNGSMVGHIRRELSPGSEQKRRLIAESFGYSYEDFLKIGSEIIDGNFKSLPIGNTQATPPDDLQQRKLQTHQHLVGGFKNQDLAVDINHLLIDYEEIAGSQGLAEIKEYIEFKINKAKQEDKTGIKKNRQGQHR